MFASLLAASLGSNRGRVGVRTVADIYAGFAIPSGSSPSLAAETEFERPFASGLELVTNIDADRGSPAAASGCGAGEGVDDGGPEACKGEIGACALA